MKMPNLFILGAQKSGTTYLAQVLSEQPDVHFSTPKETMFFSRATEPTQEGFEEYCEQYFGDAQDETWRGEGSATYLQWESALKRMQHFVKGRPKFIICLRHPIAKAISFYIHNWRRDRYALDHDLQDIIDMGIELSPYHTSLYAASVARWLDAYPREDFLFLKFDDLEANPSHFVQQATNFLDIPDAQGLPKSAVNAGLPLVWEDGGLTVDSAAAKGKIRPRFEPSALQVLHDRFIPDLERTAKLTGLDLSAWHDMPELASRKT